MENQRIAVVYYTDNGYSMQDEVHYTDRALSEKDFKKWYNHIFKTSIHKFNAGVADVFALYEDEVGDTCELAQYWGIQEMKHNPMIPMV